MRRHSLPVCIGQKQRWFMLRVASDCDNLRFDCGTEAEFDRVRWVDYWRPVNEVIYFKRRVYAQALMSSAEVRTRTNCRHGRAGGQNAG